MSMGECPKCWEVVCECGHEYKDSTTEYLIKMRDMFQRLISERDVKVEMIEATVIQRSELTYEQVERENCYPVDSMACNKLKYSLRPSVKFRVFKGLLDCYETKPNEKCGYDEIINWKAKVRRLVTCMLDPDHSMKPDSDIIEVYQHCIQPALFNEEEVKAIEALSKARCNTFLIKKRV